MRDHLVLTEALNERVTQLLGSPGRVVCTMRYTTNIFVGVGELDEKKKNIF